MNDDRTRDLILDAAERLIGVLGYSKTTMDDVAEAAGVGKRTIYVHFPSKEEVVLCTIDRIVERLVARLREHAAAAGPAAERLRRDARRTGAVPVRQRARTTRTGWTSCSRRCGRRTWPAASGTSPPRPRCSPRCSKAGHAAGRVRRPRPARRRRGAPARHQQPAPVRPERRELGRRKDVEARAGRVADLLLFGLCRGRKPGSSSPVHPSRGAPCVTLRTALALASRSSRWSRARASSRPPTDRTIDAAERKAVIDGVLEKVEANYVFPDVGKKMAEAIRDRGRRRRSTTRSPAAGNWPTSLTKHLREVCKDKHLGVRY